MDPVKTEEGYVKVQHSLMEFCQRARPRHRQHHELRPYGLRDRAGQGRRIAAALHRYAPAGAPEPARASRSTHQVKALRLVQLPGADRPRRVRLRWHRGRRRPPEAGDGRQGRPTAPSKLEGRKGAGGRGRRAVRRAAQHRRLGLRRHGPADRPGPAARRAGPEGHHARDLDGRLHRQVRRLHHGRGRARRQGGDRGRATSPTSAKHRRHRQRRHRASSPCSPPSSWPASWPAR